MLQYRRCPQTLRHPVAKTAKNLPSCLLSPPMKVSRRLWRKHRRGLHAHEEGVCQGWAMLSRKGLPRLRGQGRCDQDGVRTSAPLHNHQPQMPRLPQEPLDKQGINGLRDDAHLWPRVFHHEAGAIGAKATQQAGHPYCPLRKSVTFADNAALPAKGSVAGVPHSLSRSLVPLLSSQEGCPPQRPLTFAPKAPVVRGGQECLVAFKHVGLPPLPGQSLPHDLPRG